MKFWQESNGILKWPASPDASTSGWENLSTVYIAKGSREERNDYAQHISHVTSKIKTLET
jgi:hypothetical protein